MARREASILNESMASFPQAPYDCNQRYTTPPQGIAFGVILCLRSSVDNAAAPADNPATDTILGFSGDVMSLRYLRQLVYQGPNSVAKCLRDVSGHGLKQGCCPSPPSHSTAGFHQHIAQMVVTDEYVSSFFACYGMVTKGI